MHSVLNGCSDCVMVLGSGMLISRSLAQTRYFGFGNNRGYTSWHLWGMLGGVLVLMVVSGQITRCVILKEI